MHIFDMRSPRHAPPLFQARCAISATSRTYSLTSRYYFIPRADDLLSEESHLRRRPPASALLSNTTRIGRAPTPFAAIFGTPGHLGVGYGSAGENSRRALEVFGKYAGSARGAIVASHGLLNTASNAVSRLPINVNFADAAD